MVTSASAAPPQPTSTNDAASTTHGVRRLTKLTDDGSVCVVRNIKAYHSSPSSRCWVVLLGAVPHARKALFLANKPNKHSQIVKNQSPRKTGDSDTHHSHLEEVVPTIRTNHWEILENSCKFPLSICDALAI